jgi:Right handed beta helix region
MAYPDASTTGPAAGGYTSLTPQTAQDIPASAPYPSWVTVLGGGALLVQECSFTGAFSNYASDITFAGCQWTVTSPGDAAVTNRGGDNVTFTYCQISAPDDGQVNTLQYCILNDTGDNLTVQYCNLFWWENAIQIGMGNDATITGNYIHDPVLVPGAHLDGLYFGGDQSGLSVTGNTILNSQDQTSAVAFFQDNGGYDGVTVSGNLLGGGGYCIYAGAGVMGTVTNMVIEDNQFTQIYFPAGGYYGLLAAQPDWGSDGNVLSGNTWYSMTWNLVDSDTGTGTTTSDYVYSLPGGAPAQGNLVVLLVNVSGNTCTTPAGWTAGPSVSSNLSVSSYIFYLIAGAGASSTVTLSLSGNSYLLVGSGIWSAANGVTGADQQATAVLVSGVTESPVVTTGTLAAAGELSVGFAGGFNGGEAISGLAWSPGYIALCNAEYSGDSIGLFAAYNADAGTAPESPQISGFPANWGLNALVQTFEAASAPGSGSGVLLALYP